MNGLLDLAAVPRDVVRALVARALELGRGAEPGTFAGRAVGLLFLEPSLRSQATFQRAAQRLGADPVLLSGGASGVWSLETRDGAVMDGASVEHVRDAARVLGRLVDVLCVRSFEDGVVEAFQRHAGKPVVSMESAHRHPCQALADWTTLDAAEVPERARLVLSWAWHPRVLPRAVPSSTLLMAAQRGMEVTVLRPEGFGLGADVMETARALAAESGGAVEETDDTGVLGSCEVVYAKSWGACDPAVDARARDAHRSWCVGAEALPVGPDARFMHCLPVRRGVVATDAVIDGPGSLVIDQAENRLHAQTALLERILAAADAPRTPTRSQDLESLAP